MMNKDEKYFKLGVDVHKTGIEVFQNSIRSEYPYAFTPIIKDYTGENIILHVDGVGSKPIVAYLYFKETGDHSWFKGLTQDVIAMNIDDVVPVGAYPVAFADYIALNPYRVPKTNVLNELGRGFKETIDLIGESTSHLKTKVSLLFAGGETADLPDQIRTLDIVGIVYAKIISNVVAGDKIEKGDVIIGLRSGGKALYEDRENSGIMCNGLTLARHIMLSKEYKMKYPEISDSLLEREYSGYYKIDSYLDELGMTVGEALLSPTRIYTPIIADILEKFPEKIKGMVHNTGGGLTKILRIGHGLKYIKDTLPPPDPLFRFIQREGRISWREMYEVFNMGIGFEIITTRDSADDIINISEKYGVDAYTIGRVAEKTVKVNEVVIKSENGVYAYKSGVR